MTDEITIQLRVNGIEHTRTVPTRMMLASFLRDELGLTGTKLSCELQVCGVCTVLVDRKPVSACTFLAADADASTVQTIEGLATEGALHPIQESFVEHFAFQCGFCTPGFIMMTDALLEREPQPSTEQIHEWFEGNICRCTGYRPIVEAVHTAADRMGNEEAKA